MKEELEKKLAEVRKAIKALLAIENMSDEDAEKLDNYNHDAVKLEARLTGLAQAEKEEKETAERIKREKDEAVAEAVKAEAAKHRRLRFEEAPYQTQFHETGKFNELTAGETALLIDVMASQGKPASGAAFKALSLKIGELKDAADEEAQKGVNYVRNAFKAYTKTDPTPQATSDAVKAATDPLYTGGAGVGLEWVGTAYSAELWQNIRAANVIVSSIPSTVIPDGYSSIYYPLEGADPTWYKVAEASASDSTLKVPAATVTASQAGSANKQLTVGKLGARTLHSGEMDEDSLVRAMPELRRKLQVSGSEILEHVAIDGDVETSANKNINTIDGTPNAAAPYLLLDGFRKLALVTNTANSRSASGGLVVEDFIDTLKLMGVAGIAADPRQVAFLADFNVRWAAMKLPESKTRDVYSAATFENGFLTQAFGYQVLYGFQMHRTAADRKANTAGKVATTTPANNTTGAIVAVRFDQWKQAFKRRMTVETTRIANADAWEIVALVRWGMAYRDNEASAITYNVGI